MPDTGFSGARVVVTGALGRLGRRITVALRRAGFDVIGLDRTVSAEGDVPVITGSILDADALAQAFAGADTVVHAAALLSAHGTQAEIFDVNTRGTWTVFDTAARCGVRRVVSFSSECAIGQCFQRIARPPRFLPIDEEHPLEPQDAYSLSKQIGEAIAASFVRSTGRSAVILRPTWVMFPITPEDLAAHRGLMHGDMWCWVAPDDVADATVAAATLDTELETFFLGAPNTLCTQPTLELLAARFGTPPELRRPEFYAVDPTASLFDCRRAAARLGFRPTRDWAALMKATP